MQDGRVAESRSDRERRRGARLVSVFQRLPLFSTRELRATEYHVRVRGRTAPRNTWSFWPWARPPGRQVHVPAVPDVGRWRRRMTLVAASSRRPPLAAARRPAVRSATIRSSSCSGSACCSSRSPRWCRSPTARRSCCPTCSAKSSSTRCRSSTCLMVALVFVLARNVLKLIVERRRALPFARFRAKLVAVAARHDARSRPCSC